MDKIIAYLVLLICALCIIINLKKKNEVIILSINESNCLRGLAIVGVIFNHLVQHTQVKGGLINKFYFIGYLFVGLFFMLSGFGNYESYKKKNNITFMWLIKRLARVYVTYIIVFIISIIAYIVLDKCDISLRYILYNLVTIRLPGWLNWYIKILFLSYILFFVSFKFNKNKEIILTCMVVLSILIMKCFGLYSFWWNSLLCFVLGIYLSKYKCKVINLFKNRNKWIIQTLALISFILLYVLERKVNSIFGIASSIMFCIFVLSINAYYTLGSKIIEFIGKISLEIYLWHLVFLKLLFNNNLSNNINVLLLFIISVILSFYTNKIVSKVVKK